MTDEASIRSGGARRSRRQLLAGGTGALAAVLAAEALARPAPADAADGDRLVLGRDTETSTTILTNSIDYAPGGGDDAAAIAAIAAGLTGGGIIDLPGPGPYNWATPQTISNPRVKLRGPGFMQTANAGLVASGGWAVTPMLTLAGEGCALEGVQVSGAGLAQNLIAVTGSNCRLINCGTRSPAAGGVCLDIRTGGASCWVIGGRYNGLAANSLAAGSIGIQVNDTDAIICGTKPVNQAVGIMVLGGASGAIIQGNHITAGNGGMNDIWLGGAASNILVQGNRFDNCANAPLQLSPVNFPQNVSILGNLFKLAGIAAGFPYIGYDTSAAGIRGLQIDGNTAYAAGTNVPTWFLDTITQAGNPATNTARVGGTGGFTQAVGNVAWCQNAGMFASLPTQIRDNMVSVDGLAYATATPPLATPGIGASPATIVNIQCDAFYYFTGGTVSSIKVNGITVAISTNVTVYVPARAAVVVTYTAVPILSVVAA
jgi:hypothetical protein